MDKTKNSLAELLDEHHSLTLRRNDLDALAGVCLKPSDPDAMIRIVIDTEEFVFMGKHYRSVRSIVISALRGYYRDLDRTLLDEIEDAQ